MPGCSILVWFISVLCACAVFSAYGNEITVCPGSELVLRCNDTQVITGNIAAGIHSNTSDLDCAVKEGDCQARPLLLLGEIHDCLWRESTCSFTANSQGPLQPPCASHFQYHYLTSVGFECLERDRVFAMSRDDGKTCEKANVEIGEEDVVYIHSENFPQPFRSTKCDRLVQTMPGFGLNITSIHLDLPVKKDGTCEQYVGILTSQQQIWCGDDQINISIWENQLRLFFHADAENSSSRKGFVLKIYAFRLSTRPTTATTSNPTSSTLQATVFATQPTTPNYGHFYWELSVGLGVSVAVLGLLIVALSVGIVKLVKRQYDSNSLRIFGATNTGYA